MHQTLYWALVLNKSKPSLPSPSRNLHGSWVGREFLGNVEGEGHVGSTGGRLEGSFSHTWGQRRLKEPNFEGRVGNSEMKKSQGAPGEQEHSQTEVDCC